MRLLMVVIPILTLAGCHTQLETKAKHVVHSGEQALLIESGRQVALAAVAKGDAHALARAEETRDQAVIDKMLKEGKALEIKNGTPVKVVSESFNERQVQLLGGPLAGKSAWVPFEWLKPDPLARQ